MTPLDGNINATRGFNIPSLARLIVFNILKTEREIDEMESLKIKNSKKKVYEKDERMDVQFENEY